MFSHISLSGRSILFYRFKFVYPATVRHQTYELFLKSCLGLLLTVLLFLYHTGIKCDISFHVDLNNYLSLTKLFKIKNTYLARPDMNLFVVVNFEFYSKKNIRGEPRIRARKCFFVYYYRVVRPFEIQAVRQANPA